MKMKRFLTLFQMTKFLDWSKFKAFADDKLNVAKKLKFFFDRVEKCMGKEENAGYLGCNKFRFNKIGMSKKLNLFWEGRKTFWGKYQHFLLFPTRFQKICSLTA